MASGSTEDSSQKDASEDEKPESPVWYRERAEKNRQKALLLKKSKIISHPYTKENTEKDVSRGVLKVQEKKVIDSGAGFLIEDDDELERDMLNLKDIPAPIIQDLPKCELCHKEFKDSILLTKFDYSVCDSCRDPDDKHSLITKSEAKEEYLLKECDFDKREPPLKYIVKKNPHNNRWGEMKLYLHLQVEKRALEVWGSEEALMKERERRDEKRSESKIKRYNKKVKQLRMEVRSSVYDKTKKASHTHKFSEDVYNEADDTYTHVCIECNYEETYEKM